MEHVAFHYLTQVTTTKSCMFFEDELDVRERVFMKWLEMCSKQDKNVMGSYMMKKGWQFKHFVNYFGQKLSWSTSWYCTLFHALFGNP